MTEHEQPEERQLTFEQALNRLENVVQKLEDGDVPLEQAIELFQEGMALSKRCSEQLDRVERRIEILIQENGDWVKKPFSPEEE